MKKKNNNINTRSDFRGRRNLILCNYIDKLILKTDYNPENEINCPNNFDNFFDIDDCILKLFFFRSYSVYYFRISEVIFVGTRRCRFDQISANPFRVNR